MDSQTPSSEKSLEIQTLRAASRNVDKLLQDPNYREWFATGEVVAHRFDYEKPRVDLAATKAENQSAYLSVSQLEALVLLPSEKRRSVYAATLTETHFALIDAYENLYYPKIIVDRFNKGIEDFSPNADVRSLLIARLKIEGLEKKLSQNRLSSLRKKIAVCLGAASLVMASWLVFDGKEENAAMESPLATVMPPDYSAIFDSALTRAEPLASHPPATPSSIYEIESLKQYLENSHPPATPATTEKAKPKADMSVNAMLLATNNQLASVETTVVQDSIDDVLENIIHVGLDYAATADLELSPPTTTVVEPEPSQNLVNPTEAQKEEWLTAAGIAPDDWQYVDFIVRKESNWQPFVWNQQGSSAYGLCQTMMSLYEDQVAEDFMTNPVSQLKWCHAYALSRYGSWQKAHTFWKNNGWW